MLLCNSCPNRCNADRENSLGYCGVKSDIKLARAGLHFGEEPCISGKNGSGTIFFSGCSLKCVFCQNYDISHNGFGEYVSQDRFINIIKELEYSGAHNINLVTPTHYFSPIKDALSIYRPSIPIICNSSGFENIENIDENIFDIYLFDLKYFSREKSKRYSNAENYFDIAGKAIKRAYEIIGAPEFDDMGLLKRGLVVRHLILPSSTNDSIKIIEWLNDSTPNIIFSLMSQYVPLHESYKYPEINRKITKREYNKVLEKCYECNFSEIYVQDLSSATTNFIPKFDLTGI